MYIKRSKKGYFIREYKNITQEILIELKVYRSVQLNTSPIVIITITIYIKKLNIG